MYSSPTFHQTLIAPASIRGTRGWQLDQIIGVEPRLQWRLYKFAGPIRSLSVEADCMDLWMIGKKRSEVVRSFAEDLRIQRSVPLAGLDDIPQGDPLADDQVAAYGVLEIRIDGPESVSHRPKAIPGICVVLTALK